MHWIIGNILWVVKNKQKTFFTSQILLKCYLLLMTTTNLFIYFIVTALMCRTNIHEFIQLAQLQWNTSVEGVHLNRMSIWATPWWVYNAVKMYLSSYRLYLCIGRCIYKYSSPYLLNTQLIILQCISLVQFY